MSTIISIFKKLLRRPKKTPSPVVEQKNIIQRNHHRVSKTDISPNALSVLNRLNSSGFQAYLVGGSVRDLLLRKSPKDFDIATNATPNQIKKLFRNARIIGRRFKLAHIIFHREIIEVATFRGHDEVDENKIINDKGILVRDNVFGTLEEDSWRRDFTINSLYYNLTDSTIVDFTGGFADIQQQLIRMIGNPTTRYQEDPVRMLRAIRFSAKLDFPIAPETEAPIRQLSSSIRHISGSRLFDEMVKLYQCGKAQDVQTLLVKYGLFEQLFPHTHRLFESDYPVSAFFNIALENTDRRLQDNKPVTPAFIFAALLWFPLLHQAAVLRDSGIDPLPALEQAMASVLYEQNQIVTIPKRFSQVMREIWMLQFRFSKRSGLRAFELLQHPRFRAGYDFLALRALSGDESTELADWWTLFQDATPEEQQSMVNTLTPPVIKKRRKRSTKKKAPESK